MVAIELDLDCNIWLSVSRQPEGEDHEDEDEDDDFSEIMHRWQRGSRMDMIFWGLLNFNGFVHGDGDSWSGVGWS